MLDGAVGSVSALTQTLVKATPLLLVGLGVLIAYRGGVVNIGGEGQLIVGALAATALSIGMDTWPRWLLLPACLPSPALHPGLSGAACRDTSNPVLG